MPPMPPISGIAGAPPSSLGISVTIAMVTDMPKDEGGAPAMPDMGGMGGMGGMPGMM